MVVLVFVVVGVALLSETYRRQEIRYVLDQDLQEMLV